MKLSERQQQFARMVPRLIDKAHELGYEVTLGDAFRDERVFGPIGTRKGYGHPKSCHKVRLAIDLNLFRNGQYLTGTQDHRLLGEWWQSIGGTWGGTFHDANHYSLDWDGMK